MKLFINFILGSKPYPGHRWTRTGRWAQFLFHGNLALSLGVLTLLIAGRPEVGLFLLFPQILCLAGQLYLLARPKIVEPIPR